MTDRTHYCAGCKGREDIIEKLEADNARLREALGWYEKQVNDCRKITREGDDARYALDRDGGERARAALGETE